jgi:hypothetical protein
MMPYDSAGSGNLKRQIPNPKEAPKPNLEAPNSEQSGQPFIALSLSLLSALVGQGKQKKTLAK